MSILENGIHFSKLPNIYIDQFLKHMNGSEFKVLSVIVRKTIGYQKRTDVISLTQFEDITGLSRNTIRTAIDELLDRKLINRREDGNSFIYELNQRLLADSTKIDTSGSTVSNFDSAKSDIDIHEKFARGMMQLLNPLKKELKETKEKSSTNIDHDRQNLVQRVIAEWDKRFNNKVKLGDQNLMEGIQKAIEKFTIEQIITAMDNRLQAKYYQERKPELLHRPNCFFPYLDTIENDLNRAPSNMYTFVQMEDMVASHPGMTTDEFQKCEHITDENGKPMWKHLKR